MEEQEQQQKNIEKFKVKKLVKFLNNIKGSGTSVVTLLIPPGEQISRVIGMLTNELGTCSCIKSASNRKSVESAITSAIERLKLISRVPKNGLIIYSGEVVLEDGKDKRLTLDIEPLKPVSRSLYLCDNRFNTEELEKMLENDDKFGFIIVDGTGASYYTVSGCTKEKIMGFNVELPKKHGRGGQSKNRFARIRQEKRHNYLRKVAETATNIFISNDKPNVKGLILAGSAEFKESLFETDMFDPRLKTIVSKIVDIQHSGDVGFNQALTATIDVFSNVKIVQEKKLLSKLYDEIAKDTCMYCYGIQDTMKCMEMGAVQTIILYEDLNMSRFEVYNDPELPPNIYYMTHDESLQAPFRNEKSIVIKEFNFVEWITENYNKLGCSVELVSDKSQEGTQFTKGFGGVGGLLRYRVDLVEMERLHENALRVEINDLDDDFM
jgi:peptide chain release factor subunit 1